MSTRPVSHPRARLGLVSAALALLLCGLHPSPAAAHLPTTSFRAAPAAATSPAVALASAPADFNTQDQDELGPLELTPADGVDESKFVFHVLRNVLRQWSYQVLDSNLAANWAVDQRLMLRRLQSRTQQASLAPEVTAAVDDALRVFDAHDDYLVQIGAATRETLARAQEERGKLFATGVDVLADRAQAGAYSGQGGLDQAAGEAIAAGIIGILADAWNESERAADEQAKRDYAASNFRTALENTRVNVARTALGLASQRGWNVQEISFDDSSGETGVMNRPTDPWAVKSAVDWGPALSTAAELSAAMQRMVDAARLVPAGTEYDAYRAEMLTSASALAKSAALAAWFEDPNHSYGGEIARNAVRVCRTRLQYDPDFTDVGKYELALALNAAGRHAEALSTAAAAKALHQTMDFAYNYACLCSLNGETASALEWFKYSLQLGNTNVLWYCQDPELAQLRAAHTEEFTELVQVKVEGELVWGIFNDDYQLTNNSIFPITNVVIEPVIVLNNETVKQQLTVSRIEPGETYTWVNVFSISQDDFVRLEFGEWRCDQKQ